MDGKNNSEKIDVIQKELEVVVMSMTQLAYSVNKTLEITERLLEDMKQIEARLQMLEVMMRGTKRHKSE